MQNVANGWKAFLDKGVSEFEIWDGNTCGNTRRRCPTLVGRKLAGRLHCHRPYAPAGCPSQDEEIFNLAPTPNLTKPANATGLGNCRNPGSPSSA